MGSGPSSGAPDGPRVFLDGDCVPAAQALLAGGPADVATVATDDVGRLSRFIDARLWETMTA